jgi:hypothetical protein
MSYPYGGITTPAIAQTPGLGNVNSYLISAYPWLSGSSITGSAGEVKMEFYNVSRKFTVINTGDELIRIHFDTIGNVNVVNKHHYFTLGTGSASFAFAVRCKEFYVSKAVANLNTASFDVIVEMTSIPAASMHTISGSGINL